MQYISNANWFLKTEIPLPSSKEINLLVLIIQDVHRQDMCFSLTEASLLCSDRVLSCPAACCACGSLEAPAWQLWQWHWFCSVLLWFWPWTPKLSAHLNWWATIVWNRKRVKFISFQANFLKPLNFSWFCLSSSCGSCSFPPAGAWVSLSYETCVRKFCLADFSRLLQ